jgi:chromosome segregation ATPase
LEDDNSALQARLKSEQLVSTDKLKKKDDVIAILQKDQAQVKKELQARDADPNSNASLKKDVDTIRAEADSAREDLEEAKKLNGMLEEEIEDSSTLNTDLQAEIKTLQTEVAVNKKQTEEWKRKAEDWKNKASEWTDKTFQWKEKAEQWEKTAKELDPDTDGETKSQASSDVETAPQALFLQAAMERKKAEKATDNAAGRGWGRISGIFAQQNVPNVDESEAEARVRELEDQNVTQADTIKRLQSEMVKMQAGFKEEAYMAKQKMQQLRNEHEANELKNANLMKELALARKLESFAADR